MKFFAVFAAVLAIAAAAPTTEWTMNDLSSALQNPSTPYALRPYLEAALNSLMEAAFSGQNVETVVVPTPAGLLPVEAVSPVAVMPVGVVEPEATPALTTEWTMNDLSSALQNPATPEALRPYLEAALNTLMEAAFSGQNLETIVVPTPAGLLPVEAITPVAVMPVGVVEPEATPALTTEWTINDLSSALQNPATPYALRPYLEAALNSLMEAVFSGQNIETIVVPTPAGLLPIEALSPVAVMPVGVVEAEEPLAPVVVAEPTPAVVADASGSPLVQIIVNIKTAEVAAAPEAPANVVEESPVLIPAPVIVVPEVPEPVIIAPAPAPEVPVVIAPAPVEVSPVAPENPIDVIAIVAPENPIDVIAVIDTETNPIDLLQPVPVAVAGGASQGILV